MERAARDEKRLLNHHQGSGFIIHHSALCTHPQQELHCALTLLFSVSNNTVRKGLLDSYHYYSTDNNILSEEHVVNKLYYFCETRALLLFFSIHILGITQ